MVNRYKDIFLGRDVQVKYKFSSPIAQGPMSSHSSHTHQDDPAQGR